MTNAATVDADFEEFLRQYIAPRNGTAPRRETRRAPPQPRRQPASGFQVERGVPVPPKSPFNSRRGRQEAYPWSTMKVGDSFFVRPADCPRRDGKTRTVSGLQNLLGVVATTATKAGKGKFTTRQMDGGVRVWRIA